MTKNGEAQPIYRAGYPLFVDLHDREVVVIGAGSVAERKIETLLAYGARVHVIAPLATEAILTWAKTGRIQFSERKYQQGDLAGISIAFCACGCAVAEKDIFEEARTCGCLLNVVDVPDRCDFTVPSILERGPLRVAVSTSGCAPTEAKRIRHALEDEFDQSWDAYLVLMGEVRALIKARIPGSDKVRKPIFEAASDAGWLARLASGENIDAEQGFSEACARAGVSFSHEETLPEVDMRVCSPRSCCLSVQA